MTKILVTGCAGFIGSHLCEKLLDCDYEVYGIDNLNNYYDQNKKLKNLKEIQNNVNSKKFSFVKDSLIDTEIISQHKFDVVINLGAMAGVRYSLENPQIYIDTNIKGHVHLLEECVKNNIKLYIYASSSSVYGLNTKIPFEEGDNINKCNSIYAITKKSGEDFARLYSSLYNLKTIGLRFFTVYGPRGRPDMLPDKLLKSIINGISFDKYGNGETYRDYTYIDDIINGIMGAIINKNNRVCEVYNLGNNNPVTLNTFIETCENITQSKANFIQKSEQPGDVPFTCADITKAQNDLDYEPKTSLHIGLAKTYDYLLKNIV